MTRASCRASPFRAAMHVMTTITFIVCVGLMHPSARAADLIKTERFVEDVASGNAFEIETSRLAPSKTDTKDVLGFAEQMVSDHTAAAGKFRQALTEANLKAPAPTMDETQKFIYESLAKKNRDSFDKAYIDAQHRAHEEAVEMFEAYAAGGENAKLKQFAQEMLPTLRLHLQHITKLWKAGSP